MRTGLTRKFMSHALAGCQAVCQQAWSPTTPPAANQVYPFYRRGSHVSGPLNDFPKETQPVKWQD